ncbi:hypothetical protein PanWU01x14_185610 [Parasponia andersonii]|uniref:Uncharacterized protein n=1 Tax=Parasponia andersonii TaxID=3476 RepID=A0A2P5C3W6_PARAD|nr:hypothetical protein PanWU01x14_185610 [Parasponia andersonii]
MKKRSASSKDAEKYGGNQTSQTCVKVRLATSSTFSKESASSSGSAAGPSLWALSASEERDSTPPTARAASPPTRHAPEAAVAGTKESWASPSVQSATAGDDTSSTEDAMATPTISAISVAVPLGAPPKCNFSVLS